jgi:phosphomannomutase
VLVETNLQTNLLALFNAMKQTPMSDEDYAEKLAKIITDHIKTAQVNPGIKVQVSPLDGTGATIAPGSLS